MNAISWRARGTEQKAAPEWTRREEVRDEVQEEMAGMADEAVFGYIERFATVLTNIGIPPMPSRVFAALLVTDSGRLTAAEIAAELRISPAAVSGAVRYLVQLGLAHKERVPGSRRDYYRIPENVWHDMFRMRDQAMLRWAAIAREGMDLVGPDSPARARLAENADFIEFAVSEMPGVLARWDEHRKRDSEDG